MKKPYKIVIITDVHYGADHPGSTRRCSIADVLLERAVRRVNRMVTPDVVLVLGDLLDLGSDDGAEERLQVMRKTLDGLDAPYLAIPGNHDDDVDQFYRVFDRPAEWEDIAGTRFLAFVDRDEPGYNASRSEADIQRVRRARADYTGPIVALQHVCLFPPGKSDAPYNYTNASEIIDVMKEAGVTLSVSGHHHHGAKTVEEGCVTFVTAPGLCESPFPIFEILLGEDCAETQRHELAMPESLKLTDQHMHTELAYCSENMSVERNIALAKEFGLAGLTLTEHSGQLYFDRKPYWQSAWMNGVETADPAFNRMPKYFALKDTYESEYTQFSLEVEVDVRGNLVLKSEDRKHFDHLLGTIHALSGLTNDAPPCQRDIDEFLFLVDALGKQGVRALAHPLRVFRRAGWDVPEVLFEATARLLKEHDVAAELNSHTNYPPLGFVQWCLKLGVKFTLASDAHNLAEIGDFAYHIDLLKEAGFDGDLEDILLR